MNVIDLKQIKDLLKKEFSRNEKRLDQKLAGLEERMDQKLANTEQTIIRGVGDFIHDHLIPLIDEKADKTDIDRVERKLDVMNDKLIDHENRIRRIESIPVVAHQIKK